MPYQGNCTLCPANSYQPKLGASNTSACVMCPAGLSPAAVNASSCSNLKAATSSVYTSTLYSAVGGVLGGGLLAAAGTMLVMGRRKSKQVPSPAVKDVAEELPVNLEDVEAMSMELTPKTLGIQKLTHT